MVMEIGFKKNRNTTHTTTTKIRKEIENRLKLVEKYLEEAEKHIDKKDPIQASEKMYKVVEECIKILAQIHNTPEYNKAVKEGRWWTQLFGKAARKLSKKLNQPKIESTWSIAYDIHVWGFHEQKYSIEDIEEDIKHIKWLLNYTKQTIAENT